MKKYFASSLTLLFISFFTSGTLFAQVTLNDGDAASSCITLQSSLLRYGTRDASSNGEVSIVQDFLIDKGLLTGSPTGFYGRMTVTAVKSYQASKGVSQTGNVGPLTRALIQSETCGTTTPVCILDTPYTVGSSQYASRCVCPTGTTESNLTASGVVGSYTFKCTTSVMCTMQVRLCPDGTTMPRDPNCAWREDKCPNASSYSLGLLPITTSQALKTGISYTTGWTGTGNPASPSYTVDLVKGSEASFVVNLGTAVASQKSFAFSFPGTVVTGSDYRLRFGGTGGEMTNIFSIQGANISAAPFALSTSSLSFNYVLGGAIPNYQTVTFTNTTASNIVYTVAVPNQPSWLNTSYITGSVIAYPGSPLSVSALVNTTSLAAGTYTSNIVITGNFTNSPIVIPITLVISSSANSTGPKVTLSYASTKSNSWQQAVTLSYVVTNATYCSASGGWNGRVSAPSTGPSYWTGNVEVVYPRVGATYTLTCYDALGASDTQTVQIGATSQ